uniref:Uncharacterized protein n=1 Tax=Ciona savignyi TaxID=51511 RepID=H2Z445_CIOSA
MAELNQIKKEKEELVEELKGANSTVRALQCQLETVEEKLNESEKALMESEKLIREERKRGELVENEMHQQILLLRKQLEESDNAVAVATSERECSTTKDQKTQTIKKKKESVQVQAVPAKVLEQEFVINDLRSQVEDLTTRLSMGADAYKEKFVECHKLEKKVKKLKMLQKPDAAPPAASKATPAKEEEAEGVSPVNQGFMNKLEKLFLSIADPDAEEQEQSKQLQQKLDEMARGVEKEHNRYRRYKQLYAEEKHKAMTRLASANATTAEINHKYKAEKERCKVLVVENEMLKSQLDEFVRSSTDAAVRNVMTCDPTAQDRTPRETPDDEAQFQDAQEFPVLGDKADSSPSGSSETDEGLEYNGQSLNFCTKGEATSSEEKSDSDGMEIARPSTKPISIAPVGKSKVISCQPIRSPPVPSDVISSSSQSEGPSAPRTDARKKKGKGKKGKTRKTVRPVM